MGYREWVFIWFHLPSQELISGLRLTLYSLNIAVLPPSTTISWQETKLPASLARYKAASAISKAKPERLRGTAFARLPFNFSSFSSDNPKICTYHSAKGCQFNDVFIPNCEDELIDDFENNKEFFLYGR